MSSDLLEGPKGDDTKWYWTVTDEDIRREFPCVLIHHTSRVGAVCMTARFVLEACLAFYDTLNARAVRRQIATIYSSRLLDDAMRSLREGHAPYQLAWQMSAVPKAEALQAVLLKGFATFVDDHVMRIRRYQLVYNGRGLRHDGNHPLAKIIYANGDDDKRPYTAVVAFNGVDGSLLEPFHACMGESMADIEELLIPLLRDIRKFGLEAGLSLEDTLPVYHSTDVYAKQRKKLRSLYQRMWPDLNIRVLTETPKGAARSMEMNAAEPRVVITGDPEHDVIKPRLCGAHNHLLWDHIDAINRLSRADIEGEQEDEQEDSSNPPVLANDAATLLRKVAVSDVATAKALIEAQAHDVSEVRVFLAARRVRRSPVWISEFRSRPPRGTLARLARRFSTELHVANGQHGWKDKRSFLRELSRIESWHKELRTPIRPRGIRRSRRKRFRKPATVFRKVWTRRVENHYRILRSKFRLTSLWNWRKVARAYHSAQINVQSGTVPVEMTWLNGLDMMPRASKTVVLLLWKLHAKLIYLRLMYVHFHKHSLPSWMRGDCLLAQRIDALLDFSRALSVHQGEKSLAAQALVEAFEK